MKELLRIIYWFKTSQFVKDVKFQGGGNAKYQFFVTFVGKTCELSIFLYRYNVFYCGNA